MGRGKGLGSGGVGTPPGQSGGKKMFESESDIENIQGEPEVFLLLLFFVPENKADGDILRDTGACRSSHQPN